MKTMYVKVPHAKLVDPLEYVHWWLFYPGAFRKEKQALGEMADGDYAPHCPLVVGFFSTPCLEASPSQHLSFLFFLIF